MIRCALCPVLLLMVAIWPAVAQSDLLHANGPLPSFEVVSIKPWKPAPPPPPLPDGTPARPRPAKVDFNAAAGAAVTSDRVHRNTTVEMLISSAFNLPLSTELRIISRQDWLKNNIYEMDARIGAAAFAALQAMPAAKQREQVALMEQALLAERFGLKMHFETRELPVYTLVVAKGGAKLAVADAGEATMLSSMPVEQGTRMMATAVTMDRLAHSPLLLGGRLVLDQTGLQGAYDFTLTWMPESKAAAGEIAGASLFTAIQEQLGLRLVAAKAPVEVIVVDEISQPAEN